MKLSRASALTGTASAFATICIPRFPAGAAEFTYKLSTSVAVAEPMSARALEAAVKIYRDSNGRLEVKVYPNSVLGTDSDALEQLRIGALEFLELGGQVLANVVPI